jgi:phage FluMu protein Com
MKVPCPNCAKILNVADESAGRRVKCPACQEVFRLPGPSAEVPSSTAVKAGPVASSGSARKAAPPSQPRAVKKAAEPTRPVRQASRREPEPTEGLCYLEIRRDEADLRAALELRLLKLIETEQLDLEIMEEDELPPRNLHPQDVAITGKVKKCDYGSQFTRYMVPFVAAFGPGSCELDVHTEIETGDGEACRVDSHARRWFGLFGGRGSTLMKLNVKQVSQQIAVAAARHITGRRFLNAHVYQCAYWSLGLGAGALVPLVGIVLGPGALALGLIALKTIKRRRLPRGERIALAGIGLGVCGLLISLLYALMGMRS